MKKLLALLFTSIIMAAGLVTVAQMPAQAECPYTGCFATMTKVTAPNKVKQDARAVIKVAVSARDGQADPRGKVTVTVKGKGFSFSKTVRYTGGKITIETSKLKKDGKYKVVGTFNAASDSVWKDSKDTDTITVK